MLGFATFRLNSDVKPLSGFKLVAQFCTPSLDQKSHNRQQYSVKNPVRNVAAQFLASGYFNNLCNTSLAKEAKRIPVNSQCIKKIIHHNTPFKNNTITPLTDWKNSTLTQMNANFYQIVCFWLRRQVVNFFVGVVTASTASIKCADMQQVAAAFMAIVQVVVFTLWQKVSGNVAEIRRGLQKC